MNKRRKIHRRDIYRRFLGVLDNDKWSRISIPIVSVVLSLIVISVILLVSGKNPIMVFSSFLRGSGFIPKMLYASGNNMLTDILSFLDALAPMLLASLSVIIALKAGLFNIGVSGQMLASGFIAYVLIGYSGLDAYLAKPLVMLVGISVGGLIGMLIGFLKYKFNINEVVSTIMINYIVSYVTGFFINAYYADPITRTSKTISEASRLTITNINLIGLKLIVPIGILLALGAVFLVRFLLDRTVKGLELKATGLNRNCARYAGMDIGRTMLMTMAISGMLAGLAGVTYYLGINNTIVPKQLAGLGYDSIAVSLLCNMSPIGSIFSSVLITIFQKGSAYMSSITGIAKEIASVIIGIILLFSASSKFIRYKAHQKYVKMLDFQQMETKQKKETDKEFRKEDNR